jgi:hypothetical protein
MLDPLYAERALGSQQDSRSAPWLAQGEKAYLHDVKKKLPHTLDFAREVVCRRRARYCANVDSRECGSHAFRDTTRLRAQWGDRKLEGDVDLEVCG